MKKLRKFSIENHHHLSPPSRFLARQTQQQLLQSVGSSWDLKFWTVYFYFWNVDKQQNSSRPHLHMRRLTAQRISRSSISWHLRLSIHIVAFTTLFPLEPLRFLRVENRAVVVRSLNSMFRCVVFHSRWNDVFNFSLPFTLLAQLYTA